METLPKSASEDRRVRGLSNPYLSFSFTAAKVIFYFGKSKSFSNFNWFKPSLVHLMSCKPRKPTCSRAR
nr:MAG TPA: hypothetical protein [Caudoviricetes sp.]